MAKRTPLYDKHVALGGKIVEFAGYDLPVQYSGVIAEHNAVRNAVGLFDVSHMGELLIMGEKAEEALNKILTNDIRGMYDGQVRYSLLPNEKGGAVDDILVYREAWDKFWLVVNGANVEKDAEWVSTHLPEYVHFENLSDAIGQIAVQGPNALALIENLVDGDNVPMKNYSFKPNVKIGGICTYLSRTGYTGEDGFEVYCKREDTTALYDVLLEGGKDLGVIPCGLGARDTLRLEASMPLYGHELGDDIPVNEVGLGFAIKMAKDDFIGKTALENHTPEYVRLGAKVVGKGIVREHCDVYVGDEKVGVSTSGTHCPTLGYPVCMLRVKKEFKDEKLFADVRGRRIELEVVPMPFYKRNKQ